MTPNYATAAAAKDGSESVVNRELTSLMSAIEDTEKAVHMLVDKIGPVLGPDRPTPADAPAEARGESCPLAAAICRVKDSVGSIHAILTQARYRVEL
jgi:hypothetical protein